jgi:hypothetical protein
LAFTIIWFVSKLGIHWGGIFTGNTLLAILTLLASKKAFYYKKN